MVSEEETKSIRRFVCGQLRDGPDLSSLTVGILKKRYLAWVGRESLSPEAKTYMKQVVAEELMKMQHNDNNGGELETKRPQNKRKREKEDDEVLSEREDEDESRAKKSRNQSGSSSESEDKEGRKTGNDSEKEEKALVEKKNNNPDSDSSSLPSLDNDQESETENNQDHKKKKTVEKEKSSKSQKVDNKTVVRLKRFIALCGVKKNYKKLLGDCRSIRSMVAVLKKELEDIGVEGNPTIKKCKKIRMQREEAQELADLDVSNILATKGRPTRRAALRQEQHDPPSSTYQRTLNSGSDSDQENTHKKRRRPSDWANLQGIISDDADNGRILRGNVSARTATGMDDNTPDEVFAELKSGHLGGWGVAQIAAGTGLAVYAMWVGILQPGFRKVPLRLQVPYIPASKAQVDNVMTLLRGRKGGLVDLGSGDGRIVLEAHRQGFTPAVGYELNPWLVRLSHFHAWRAGHRGKVSYRREDLWKVDLTECKNVTVFLAPSVLSLLQEKLQAELPDDALIVAGRFPFPDWKPCRIEGQGVDRAWAYNMQAQRQHTLRKNGELTDMDSNPDNELTKEK
ncbi:protein FAM173A-like protein [Lates japonicus]|uniref:Protein FAM173A-like protein n=1 Tax=Lates japonicus TaxID=270547 RepID=A0AAD3MW62_LATJO|nr:protein FAM173A-like protein [Lates japonicus]